MMFKKRPHKKSRAGCRSCKDRRVKCDETRPQCTACNVRNIRCEYLIRSSSPTIAASCQTSSHNSKRHIASLRSKDTSRQEIIKADKVLLNPPAPLPSQRLHMHDMRLLHHYCTSTIDTFGFSVQPKARMIQVWGKAVPQLAFEHDFLLDILLAFASAHMDHMDPKSANPELAALYQDKALRLLRGAIAGFSTDNSLAISVAATLLSGLSLVVNRRLAENRLWSVDWLATHTGIRAVLQAVPWQVIAQSRVAPIFAIKIPDPAPVLVPNSLIQMFDSLIDGDYDSSSRDILLKSIVSLGGIYGQIAQKGRSPAMAMDIMRWPFEVPNKFQELIKQQLPCALVILAHFVILFKFLSHFWWISNFPEHDVEIISLLLEPQWHPFLDFPKAAACMKDQDQILELLLSQLLPTNSKNPLYSFKKFYEREDWIKQ